MNTAELEQPVYSVAQVREIERRAIQGLGIPGYTLMTRAATAALRRLRAQWPRALRLRVVCGAGNNAGDGYVLARMAKTVGLDVRVGYLCDPAALQGDAQTAYSEAQSAGVAMAPFTARVCADAEVIVDALLGTGLQRPVIDAWADAIAVMNAASAPILALDIPSGLHADSGAVLGAAIHAQLTVTFIVPKLGLYLGHAAEHVGQVVLAGLDIPAGVFDGIEPAIWQLDVGWLRATLPGARARTAHKGEFGHVLVVGGQPGMSGAARMTAEAALRVGAGLVSVATHPQHAATLNIGRPELMCHGITDTTMLRPLLERATVLALGPGVGQGDWSRTLLAAVWDSKVPMIVDADALNLLAQEPQRRERWVLTPHPGEAGRLLGCSTVEVQADRLAAIQAIQSRYGGVVVLKGAGTLIADGSRCRISHSGNPGMASGGMGDVLSGVIVGLCAQGLALFDAAAAGVVMHALAADAVAKREGERGLLAGDLLSELRYWVNQAC